MRQNHADAGAVAAFARCGADRGRQGVFQRQRPDRLSEEEINEIRWSGISIVFQGAMNALNPVRTVGDQIAEAIIRHIPTFTRVKRSLRV
jgi:ABC-type dipeptide/oligopeptide/nickel transport system ATPase component